jgi:hypothetical protein
LVFSEDLTPNKETVPADLLPNKEVVPDEENENGEGDDTGFEFEKTSFFGMDPNIPVPLFGNSFGLLKTDNVLKEEATMDDCVSPKDNDGVSLSLDILVGPSVVSSADLSSSTDDIGVAVCLGCNIRVCSVTACSVFEGHVLYGIDEGGV